jgi:hypothetical protein
MSAGHKSFPFLAQDTEAIPRSINLTMKDEIYMAPKNDSFCPIKMYQRAVLPMWMDGPDICLSRNE